MKTVLSTPGVQELDHVAATAAAVRTWSHAGQVLAVGLLDGPQLLRMAAGAFYTSARSLAAFDEHNNAVAVTTVWSAGAAAVREMGSSSAIMGTESSNVDAVATYAAAGFTAHEQVADLRRSP